MRKISGRKTINSTIPSSGGEEIAVLETYPSNGRSNDGLSGFFKIVKNIGAVVDDTKKLRGRRVLVCGVPHLYQGKISASNVNIIFTTFESNKLPSIWIEAINQYHHCIVPHDAVRDVFRQSGIKIPVSVIQQGYYRYEQSPATKISKESFNIGFMGIPVNRKNLLKLYDACKQLKETTMPNLRLFVHTSYFYDWLDMKPFCQMREDEMVVWTSGSFNTQEMSDWYNNLCCYIFPSSGEGWSYTPRESMYLGIPTIITDIPVHKELVGSGFYKTIESLDTEDANFNGDVYGKWVKVTPKDIGQAILDVYCNKSHFENLAQDGASWIAEKWRNEDVVNELKALIVKCTGG